MLALTLAIVANFFWATVNIIDKYLVGRFCREGSVGSLLILSSLFPITLIPFAFALGNHSNALHPVQIAVLIIAGILTTCWMYFYFSALTDDDVSTVIPLFQLVPVFGLVFAFLLLKELPLPSQLLFAGITLLGACILSVEKASGRVKMRLILKLMAASALIALMNALFKFVALESDFWTSILWQSIGTLLAGIFLYGMNRAYRDQFRTFIRANAGIGITLNTLNEALAVIGNVLFAYALLLAPLAIIQTMSAYQPVFVFILTLLLSSIIPSLRENNSRSIFIQKLAGIACVVTGSVLLSLSKVI